VSVRGGSRGVEDGKEADELKAVSIRPQDHLRRVLHRQQPGTITTASILHDVLFKCILHFFRLIASAEVDNDMGHTNGDMLEAPRRFLEVGNLGTLVKAVEGFKVEELNASTGALGVIEGRNDTAVNGILVLCTRSIGGEQDDVVC